MVSKVKPLGCGNPTALATLNAGETVLGLGSGGGIDVLLSARRVDVDLEPRCDSRDSVLLNLCRPSAVQ